ncbi:DMT family transporter [Niallia sp. 01092]|uniref:DMT family transporter n=1 Tax=unclassified Niallia TaxID=2837522 RepID=UPI003FD2AEC7
MVYKAWISLLLCNFFWATNILFSPHLLTKYSPIWITVVRWIVAVAVLIPLAQIYEKPDWKEVIRKSWFKLLLMGLLGGYLFTYFTYFSLKHTTPTNVSLITVLIPVSVVVFSYFFLKEKITFIQGIGIATSLLGVIIIISSGSHSNFSHNKLNIGDLTMFIVVLSWTFYTIIGKSLLRVNPITTTAISSLFGLFIMMPFLLFSKPISIHQVNIADIGSILYLGIFSTVFAFILWNRSVPVVSTVKASISMNLVPVFTVVITLLSGETITSMQILAGAIVIVGVCLTSLKLKTKKLWRSSLRKTNIYEYRPKYKNG